MKNKGFTLVEVLVAIAIIALLGTITAIAVNGIIKKNGDKADEFQEQVILLSAKQYAIDEELLDDDNPTVVISEVELYQNDYLEKMTNVDFCVEVEKSGNKIISNKSTCPTEWTFNYTGSVQMFVVPSTKTYKIQVWGAAGSGDNSGFGGYVAGIINLNVGETLYAYVGGTNGYNGGGKSYNLTAGGASDIRYQEASNNSNPTDSASLLTRIIVAGGGGSEGSINKSNVRKYESFCTEEETKLHDFKCNISVSNCDNEVTRLNSILSQLPAGGNGGKDLDTDDGLNGTDGSIYVEGNICNLEQNLCGIGGKENAGGTSSYHLDGDFGKGGNGQYYEKQFSYNYIYIISGTSDICATQNKKISISFLNGAGGGGWYGGSGSPENGQVLTAGGGGGSGYVYTNLSHKPNGYNPPIKYQFTDVTNDDSDDILYNQNDNGQIKISIVE